jgi:hypothetical protein
VFPFQLVRLKRGPARRGSRATIRGENARGSVSRVLSTPLPGMGDHSSRRMVTHMLKQSTRTAGPEPALGLLPCHPYSTLLPVGFAVPRPLPSARCALTAPFHLSPGRSRWRSALCGTFPDPLSGAAGRYPAPWFPWSPDFPPLPCESGDRPTLWPHEYSANRSGRRGGVESWLGVGSRHSPFPKGEGSTSNSGRTPHPNIPVLFGVRSDRHIHDSVGRSFWRRPS